MAMSPQLVAMLKKMGADDLAILSSALVPAMIEEIEALSPAGAQATEALVLGAIQPAAQAALQALISKVVL